MNYYKIKYVFFYNYKVDEDTHKSWTFDQIEKHTEKIAVALLNNGIQNGDVVAMCLPHCLEYMSIALGIIRMGGICSSLYHLLKQGSANCVLCFKYKSK